MYRYVFIKIYIFYSPKCLELIFLEIISETYPNPVLDIILFETSVNNNETKSYFFYKIALFTDCM